MTSVKQMLKYVGWREQTTYVFAPYFHPISTCVLLVLSLQNEQQFATTLIIIMYALSLGNKHKIVHLHWNINHPAEHFQVVAIEE